MKFFLFFSSFKVPCFLLYAIFELKGQLQDFKQQGFLFKVPVHKFVLQLYWDEESMLDQAYHKQIFSNLY